MPNFLLAFDVDDGRAPCPERTRTVTAPQSLFLMNDKLVIDAAAKFAERLRKETDGDVVARPSIWATAIALATAALSEGER